jgi:hypothetical protein
MKRKMTKSKILALPLESFDIRALTLWVTRPQRELEKNLDFHVRLPGESNDQKAKARAAFFEGVALAQPKTVQQLMTAYPYRLVEGEVKGCGDNSLGKAPIAELKNRLIELGLTPSDWPALAPHNDLVGYLPKEALLKLPVTVIQPSLGNGDDYLHSYLGCSEEQVKSKTIRDLLQIDPTTIVKPVNRFDSAGRFFLKHTRYFVFLRQELVKKGFGKKDGDFFKWNPVRDSMNKAKKVLQKHGLTPRQLALFARIAVIERWVI